MSSHKYPSARKQAGCTGKAEETEERNRLINNDEWDSNEDVAFCLFYFKAIRRLLDIEEGLNATHLKRYFNLFHEYFDSWCRIKRAVDDRDDSIQNLQKDSSCYGVAYIYRNCALLSSAVGFHFRNALKGTPKKLGRILENKSLKVCSLGGGLASDVVAIVKVLDDIAQENEVQLDFIITIIDRDETWKSTYFTALSCLQQFHKTKLEINFISTDLSDRNAYTPETLESIQEADIITMTMLLSNCKPKSRTKILKYISELIQPRGMLFVLDWPKLDIVKSSGGPAAEMNDFHLVYEELYGYHTLDTTAVETLFLLYSKYFGNNQCNLSFDAYARVWIKNSFQTNTNSKNTLQRIFQKNEEKYRPKQSFLSSASFNTWERVFLQRAERNGWSLKGTKKFVQTNKDTRNTLLAKLIEKRKLLNSAQNELQSESEKSIEDEQSEIDIITWEKYWSSKKELALAKREIYEFSVYSTLKLLE